MLSHVQFLTFPVSIFLIPKPLLPVPGLTLYIVIMCDSVVAT